MTDSVADKGGVVRYPIAQLAIPAAIVVAVIVHGGRFKAAERSQSTRYHVTNRSSLGGTNSRGNSINGL
jgi:hypothetical protein